MRLLEAWVETPLAGAVGWTLLHSLWEGAIVSAALAAALVALRSARARYPAACLAMLVMLAGFGVTLVRVMPEAGGLQTVEEPAFPAWNVQTGTDATSTFSPSLAAAVTLACPILDRWSLDFLPAACGRLDLGMPAAPARRVLCARTLAKGTRALEHSVAPLAARLAARVLTRGCADGAWPFPSIHSNARWTAYRITVGTGRSHPAA